MKKKFITIVILLLIGVSLNAQSNIDLNKIKITSAWCLKEVDGKTVWEETPIIDVNNKHCHDEPEVLGIQYQLINQGYNLSPTGIVDDETISALNEFKEYNSN